tara:strand:+ start:323 stop:838 length:516 start_codon:yes stop_codon:yes gene_type:complete
MLDTFLGSMPGESWTKEFGSLPTDKPPVISKPEEAYESLSNMINNRQAQKEIVLLVKVGLSIETIVNSLVTQGVSQGMFNPDVAELIKIPLFFKVFDMCHNKVKNIKLYNKPIENQVKESDLERMQEVLAPDNEFLETDEDKEQKEVLNKILKNLEKEKGFMANKDMSGEF